ncbi:glycoside hydrolase family 25 protein [Dothistroma septosporum NZE10]|uniref:Glycoside hydrolase family 25 protein n=1 Tax=Dothistroma septosporum (strain NZE10 / CBS 128990) TaxID=675120 RepID=N1PNS4_DOTSN|nr:glycoside hydrolase family 25 protein [Dothistroma septosporum NZE10]
MKLTTVLPVVLALSASAAPLTERVSSVQGFDISHHQTSVDFASAYSSGLRFVIIQASEGTTSKDPSFSSHYNGTTSADFIRDGYHFARGTGDGSQESNYFLSNGDGWSNDGRTLPGMLDLEGDCISGSWKMTFSNTYYQATGRYPLLYSSPSWWQSCTGSFDAFVDTDPLVMACYSAKPCTPQGSWPYYAIWQYKDSNAYGGESDVFNGDLTQLEQLASG